MNKNFKSSYTILKRTFSLFMTLVMLAGLVHFSPLDASPLGGEVRASGVSLSGATTGSTGFVHTQGMTPTIHNSVTSREGIWFGNAQFPAIGTGTNSANSARLLTDQTFTALFGNAVVPDGEFTLLADFHLTLGRTDNRGTTVHLGGGTDSANRLVFGLFHNNTSNGFIALSTHALPTFGNQGFAVYANGIQAESTNAGSMGGTPVDGTISVNFVPATGGWTARASISGRVGDGDVITHSNFDSVPVTSALMTAIFANPIGFSFRGGNDNQFVGIGNFRLEFPVPTITLTLTDSNDAVVETDDPIILSLNEVAEFTYAVTPATTTVHWAASPAAQTVFTIVDNGDPGELTITAGAAEGEAQLVARIGDANGDVLGTWDVEVSDDVEMFAPVLSFDPDNPDILRWTPSTGAALTTGGGYVSAFAYGFIVDGEKTAVLVYAGGDFDIEDPDTAITVPPQAPEPEALWIDLNDLELDPQENYYEIQLVGLPPVDGFRASDASNHVSWRPYAPIQTITISAAPTALWMADDETVSVLSAVAVPAWATSAEAISVEFAITDASTGAGTISEDRLTATSAGSLVVGVNLEGSTLPNYDFDVDTATVIVFAEGHRNMIDFLIMPNANTGNSSGLLSVTLGAAIAQARLVQGFRFNMEGVAAGAWRVNDNGFSTNSGNSHRMTLSNLPAGDFDIVMEANVVVGRNVPTHALNTAAEQRAYIAPLMTGGGSIGATTVGGQDLAGLAGDDGDNARRTDPFTFRFPVTAAVEGSAASFVIFRYGGSGVNALPRLEVRSIEIVPAEEPVVSPTPSAEPTPSPSVEPTPSPSVEPTPTPSVEPTPSPSVEPTPSPGVEPTPSPSVEPTPSPVPDVGIAVPSPAPELDFGLGNENDPTDVYVPEDIVNRTPGVQDIDVTVGFNPLTQNFRVTVRVTMEDNAPIPPGMSVTVNIVLTLVGSPEVEVAIPVEVLIFDTGVGNKDITLRQLLDDNNELVQETIRYELGEDAPENMTVSPDHDITVGVSDAFVAVEGDINDDGRFDDEDVNVLRRYLAGLEDNVVNHLDGTPIGERDLTLVELTRLRIMLANQAQA